MTTVTKSKINVAPSSTEGHFIEGGKVINLDEINETFLVNGPAKLVTKNHTSVEIGEDCLITCQRVYDPLKNISIKSKD
jgi:hypothetical protein